MRTFLSLGALDLFSAGAALFVAGCKRALPPVSACLSVLFLWFYLPVVGACYTFKRVPFDFIERLFGCERNHYDRVAHFVVGVNAVGIAEILWQKRRVVTRTVAAARRVRRSSVRQTCHALDLCMEGQRG